MKYVVHIERLVLEGLGIAASERHRVGIGLEGELSRLLADEGLGPSLRAGGAMPNVPTAAIQLGRGGASTIGADVARAVHRGLTGSDASGRKT